MSKQNKRIAFTFYRSFYEAIKTQEPCIQAELYNAIFELSFNFSHPKSLSEKAKNLWILIEPNLLTSLKNWRNGSKPKRSHAGSQNEATPSRDKDIDLDKEKEKKYKEKKQILGEYKNISLTGNELNKLQELLGAKLDYWISKVDEGIELKGYKYKNHYLAILNWYKKDKEKNGEDNGIKIY